MSEKSSLVTLTAQPATACYGGTGGNGGTMEHDAENTGARVLAKKAIPAFSSHSHNVGDSKTQDASMPEDWGIKGTIQWHEFQ